MAKTTPEDSKRPNAKTDRGCQTATVPAGKAEAILTAGDGLYLRVRPGGLKNWFFWFTSPIFSKRRKLFFATYPESSLTEARLKAAEFRMQVQAGLDPKHEQEQVALLVPLVENIPNTVEELFQRWKTGELVNHADKGSYAAGILERHALPYLGKLTLTNLKHSVVASTLDKLVQVGKKNTAGRVLGFLRQMIGYAIERDWMSGDPTATMKKAKWAGKRVKRKRVLVPEEITLLATDLLPKAELSPEIECALWIQLSCATRIEETLLAQLHEVNFNTGVWYIPPEKQKKTNSDPRPHWVDLSPFALTWFKRLIQLPQERAIRANKRLPEHMRLAVVPEVKVDYLFPSYRRGHGAINTRSMQHALSDRQKPGTTPAKGRTRLVGALVLPGGRLKSHDLRRTASTQMREHDIPSDVIERCLNHVADDEMIQTYQHAKLRPQMKAAWLKLGEVLESLAPRRPKDVGYLDYDTGEDLEALESAPVTEPEDDDEDGFEWLNNASADENTEEDI